MTATVDNQEGLWLHLNCSQCFNAAISFQFHTEEILGKRVQVIQLDQASQGSTIHLEEALCPKCTAEFDKGMREHARLVAR
jgi:hypothetical protein